jgi:hypothetical protein
LKLFELTLVRLPFCLIADFPRSPQALVNAIRAKALLLPLTILLAATLNVSQSREGGLKLVKEIVRGVKWLCHKGYDATSDNAGCHLRPLLLAVQDGFRQISSVRAFPHLPITRRVELQGLLEQNRLLPSRFHPSR